MFITKNNLKERIEKAINDERKEVGVATCYFEQEKKVEGIEKNIVKIEMELSGIRESIHGDWGLRRNLESLANTVKFIEKHLGVEAGVVKAEEKK
jgi:hypothetical protein